MKTKILKLTKLLACIGVCAAILMSCNPEEKHPDLKLEKTSITLTEGEVATVNITAGSKSYSVSSDKESVAEAVINGNSVEITATGVGEASLTVSDTKSKQTQTISVTVTTEETYDDLTLDTTEDIDIETEESVEVKILSGSGDYSVAVAPESVASATLDGETITVAGLTAGSATLTVTDNLSTQSVNLAITVTEPVGPELTLSTSDPIYIEYHETIDVQILSGSGNYSVVVAPAKNKQDNSDINIASATIEGSTVKVNVLRVGPHGEGTTTMTVTDNETGRTATLEIKIVFMYYATATTFNMSLTVNAATEDQANVWIDWNNDGVRQTEESIAAFGTAFSRAPQAEVIMYGRITDLKMMSVRAEILDVSNNKYLKWLDCSLCKLTSLDMSNNPELYYLSCGNNSDLASLDVSKNAKLETLLASSTALTTLDMSNNFELKDLRVITAKLQSVQLGNISKVLYLYLWNNIELVSVDTSKLTELLEFNLANNAAFTGLNIENNKKLTLLNISNTGISSLNLSTQTALVSLYTGGSKLTNANYLAAMPNPEKLTTLSVWDNQLTSLDVSRFTNLATLECHRNKISGTAMTTLVNSLPDRTGMTLKGKIVIYDGSRLISVPDENVATESQIAIVSDKYWQAWDNNYGASQIPYSGVPD